MSGKPDKYQELLDEMRNSGEIPESWIDRIQTTYEASGLRTDLKETKDQYRQLMDTNSKLRDTILADRFKQFGVTISPSALRIPDDLDPTDTEKVEGWLVQAGLAESKPTTDPEERAAHDRIAAASNAGGQPTLSIADLDPSKMTEDEYYQAAALIEAQRK